jgi:HSP20 family protein
MNGDFSKLLESGINMFTKELQPNSFPNYDIFYDKDSLDIVLEIPGLNKDDIKLDFFNNLLTINCEKKKKINKPIFQGEINYGTFKKDIQLPISVTSKEHVTIKMENGTLIININIKKEHENKFSIEL